jgi:hypothetical protein
MITALTSTLPTAALETITTNLWLTLRGVLGSMGMWQLQGPVAYVLFGRINRVGKQIERLLRRFHAGTLSTRKPRTQSASKVQPQDKPPRKKPAIMLPRKFGWLVIAGKYQAAGYGSQLRTLLEVPAMAALLEASPQAKRILKPLCRALMIELPWVNPPRKPRVKKPRKPRRRTYAIASDFNPPFPRGVLAWARKEGFGKRPKD